MHFRFSLAAIALMGICSATANAQNQLTAPKQGPTSVGLVDIGYLIQNHPTMKAEMEKIRTEMTTAQDEIEARRKDLLAQSETVGKTYDSSSQEFRQKQEELLNKESRLKIDFVDKEKGFAERQAAIVAKSYHEITESIETIAKNYQFDLVLRFSREQNEMDPKKPRSVDFGIQKDVLYQREGIDLTALVKFVLDQKLASGNPPASGATQNGAPQSRAANAPANNNASRPLR